MAILTISRQFGSIDKEITQTMARLWDYEYIDRRKILEEMSAQGDRWGEFGKDFDEHYPNIWERHDWSYTGFVILSQSIILNFALKDDVVIVGRGGNFLLKEIPYALNVRIVAPLEHRIESVMKKETMSRSAAELLVKKADKDMSRSVQLIYGKNIDDQSVYDLFFDVGILPVHDIMAAIRAALLEKDKLKTECAVKLLQLKALARKVRAGIVTNPKFFIPVFDVLPGENQLLVTGIVHNPEERKKIEDAVRGLAGKVPAEFSLHYR